MAAAASVCVGGWEDRGDARGGRGSRRASKPASQQARMDGWGGWMGDGWVGGWVEVEGKVEIGNR